MTKDYIELKNLDMQNTLFAARNNFKNFLRMIKCKDETFNNYYNDFLNGKFLPLTMQKMFCIALNDDSLVDIETFEKYLIAKHLKEDWDVLCSMYDKVDNINDAITYYNRYMDGDWVNFEGDIVITCPFYLYTGGCNRIKSYQDLSLNGFSKFIVADTFVGEQNCSMLHIGDDKILGQFKIADGLICVVYLQELMKFNANFQPNNNNAIVLPNFKGKIRYEINRISLQDKENTNGKVDVYKLNLIGLGSDSATCKNLDFQTIFKFRL